MTRLMHRGALAVVLAILCLNCRHHRKGSEEATSDAGRRDADGGTDAGPICDLDLDAGDCPARWDPNIMGTVNYAFDGGLILDVPDGQVNLSQPELKGDFDVVLRFQELTCDRALPCFTAVLNCDTPAGTLGGDLSNVMIDAEQSPPPGQTGGTDDLEQLMEPATEGSIELIRQGSQGIAIVTLGDHVARASGPIGNTTCSLYFDLASSPNSTGSHVVISEIDLGGGTGSFRCDRFTCDSFLHPRHADAGP